MKRQNALCTEYQNLKETVLFNPIFLCLSISDSLFSVQTSLLRTSFVPCIFCFYSSLLPSLRASFRLFLSYD